MEVLKMRSQETGVRDQGGDRLKGLAGLLRRVLVLCLATASLQAQAPSDSAVHAILTRRAESWKGPGIVVGWSEGGKRHFVAYGYRVAGGPALDQRTVFEIGSITKTFTGLLLGDMVARGEVQLEDPIARYLPEAAKAPERAGKVITLLDLATHSSGLPRMPGNFAPKDTENPYADYGAGRMYEFLTGYPLTRDIGAQYEYSNFGMGLLGDLLARKLKLSYEQAITQRVINPLGLSETRISLSPELSARLATGHSGAFAPAKAWDLDALAGAGAIRSTTDDLLRYAEANLAPEKTRLARAITTATEPVRSTTIPGTRIGLAWHVRDVNGHSIAWHNGGTGGFHSFVAFDRGTGRAVAVLTNTTQTIDDIGFHLIDSTLPLQEPKPVVVHTEIKVDPASLDRFVGEYQLAPTFSIVVTRENDAVWAQATGQPRFQIFPEAPAKFFFKVVDAQISFTIDGAGKVTGLTLHQGGRDLPGSKIR
jgi:CubicO group peptidase (beta-lactamase class C family)